MSKLPQIFNRKSPEEPKKGLGEKMRDIVGRAGNTEVTSEKDWLKHGFQPIEPDMEDFLSEAPPRYIRDTHYIAMAMLFTLLLVACLVKVDVVIIGTGRLSSDEPPVVVQPMQLAMIRSINVKVGDVVKKGQVLATLDPTFTQADKASLATQQGAQQAEMARVQAELDGKPLALDESQPENQLQATLYRNRQTQYNSKVADFDQRIERYKNDIASTEESHKSLSQQLQVAKELEQMRSTLYEKGAGSKVTLLDAQATRLKTERDLQAADNHLDEIRHSLQSAVTDRQAFIDGWHRELLEQMVKLRADTAVTTENYTKAARLNDLVELRAPEDCVVLEIAKRSVGSVLQGAEPFATLVPLRAAMIADISIKSSDVGYVKQNDPVVIKVDAFPYQKHGFLHGHVRSIGEDSFNLGAGTQSDVSGPATAGVYHHSQIALTDTHLDDMPEGARLIPGMTLTAEIKVGTRTIISYFLYPITRGLHESIREP